MLNLQKEKDILGNHGNMTFKVTSDTLFQSALFDILTKHNDKTEYIHIEYIF